MSQNGSALLTGYKPTLGHSGYNPRCLHTTWLLAWTMVILGLEQVCWV